MKKLLLVTALFSLTAAVTFTDSLESLTHEIRMEDSRKEGGPYSGSQLEWTLGKGNVALDDISKGLKFSYDVDRDVFFNKDRDVSGRGWDTQFKLQKGYKWGTYKFIGLEYDAFSNGAEDFNYSTGPIWKLFGGSLETFVVYDRITTKANDPDRWGFDFDFDKTWIKKQGKFGSLSLWNNIELHYRFEDENNPYKYSKNNLDAYTETDFTYTTPNVGPLYASLTLYGEVFRNTADKAISLNTTYKIMPLIGAKFKINNNWSLNPYVSYEAFDRKTTYFKNGSNKRLTVTDNNELAYGLIIKWTK